jgi:hypothetical protein
MCTFRRLISLGAHHPYCEDCGPVPPSYTFQPSREPGPHLPEGMDDPTPLDLFRLFFDHQILTLIAKHTNTKGHHRKVTESSFQWQHDTNPKELEAFFGLLLGMGLIRVPRISGYWSKDPLVGQPFYKCVMSGRRFFAISRALKMNTFVPPQQQDRSQPPVDRLESIRPVLDHMKQVCRSLFHPGQNICVDERMLRFKGKSTFKQFMPNKPIKWGFKLWVLCASDNGYVVDFNVYLGRKEGQSDEGLTHNVVIKLLEPSDPHTPAISLGTGYHLYVDNYYTSGQLFKDLYERGIFAAGTIRMNRSGFPPQLRSLVKREKRGTWRWVRDDKCLYVVWKDSVDCALLSTFHSGQDKQQTVQRKSKVGSRNLISCPSIVPDYNKHMGGVDLFDQMTSFYAVLRRVYCWPIVFLYNFLETAATNSFIIYKTIHAKHDRMNKAKIAHDIFLFNLVKELVAATVKSGQPCKGGRPVSKEHIEDPSYMRPASHLPGITTSTASGRVCAVCKFLYQKRSRVHSYCKTCKVFLCVGQQNCFVLYHQQSQNSCFCRVEVDKMRKSNPNDCIFVYDCDIKW